jgi:hypothetical protein
MLLGLPHLQMAGWGVFIAFLLNYSHWTESYCFYRWVHWTVRCPPNMHYSLSGALDTSADRGVCRSRSLDPTVARMFGAHRIVWCYSPRVPSCRPHYADCPVSHWTVRCTPDMYCSLSGAPPGCWLTAHFLDFFTISFGLLFFLSLGLLHIFYVFF